MKLVTLKKQTEPATESPVLTVIEQEMEPILRGRSADQINKEFLAENSNSLPALFEAARMMYILDESKQEEAVKLTTSLEPHITGVDLQICSKIFYALRNNDFGKVDKLADDYKELCHKKFKYATIFKPGDDVLESELRKMSNENKYQLDLGGGRRTENFVECFQELSFCN